MIESAKMVKAASDVIPLSKRPGDIVILVFFWINLIFITYMVDVEQLIIANPDNFQYLGPFFEQPLEKHYREVDLNCRAPMAMAYLFGKQMLARGRGGVLLMSSLSAFQGTPLVSNYAATKAYNLLLAEGLWDELRAQGIDVLACCAGATETPAFLASKPRSPRFISVPVMEPDAVAREALASLGRKPCLITGWKNRLSSFLMRRAMPRSIAIRLMGQTMRTMYSRSDQTL